MLKTMLKSIARTIVGNKSQTGGDFSRKIKYRNKEFWGSPDGKKIKAVLMNASDRLPNGRM
ncbi:hypothetical protein [Pontibacter chitinilyticus]|uniref:hypothetical protein n=1 Tax=Pontibacter chitinilyticus TaxID=2674989 RepID=UPI00321BFD71